MTTLTVTFHNFENVPEHSVFVFKCGLPGCNGCHYCGQKYWPNLAGDLTLNVETVCLSELFVSASLTTHCQTVLMVTALRTSETKQSSIYLQLLVWLLMSQNGIVGGDTLSLGVVVPDVLKG
jgi:hypothetical protein